MNKKVDNKKIGSYGENLAVIHLSNLGYVILETNYQNRIGELDIIAYKQPTLTFCEVKTRTLMGNPFESVTYFKQQKIKKMAAYWLSTSHRTVNKQRYKQQLPILQFEEIRFDAIGIWLDNDQQLIKLEHLEAIF